jgi:hypothetical protein
MRVSSGLCVPFVIGVMSNSQVQYSFGCWIRHVVAPRKKSTHVHKTFFCRGFGLYQTGGNLSVRFSALFALRGEELRAFVYSTQCCQEGEEDSLINAVY